MAELQEWVIKWMDWASWQPMLQMLWEKSFMVASIILVTYIVLKLRKLLIQRVFTITRLEEKQRKTLESLLMSFSRYVIFIVAFMMALSNLGLEIGPIIASAGVIGLAVGFGAQTLVKDLITGFFIIFEDQFSVGDFVTINGGQINGTVVSVGLRATKIRTWAQHVVVIQNSEIRVSENYNRERMRAIVSITVPYETDPADVEQVVHSVSEKMVKESPHLFLQDGMGNVLEAPQLYGITDIENNALGAKYTIIALVRDEHYWTGCKELRKELMKEFKARNLHIAYPRRVERWDEENGYKPSYPLT